MGGLGFALAGEATTVRTYAEGETEEMPAIGKMLSGLAASAGGITTIVIGVMHMMR